MNITVELSLMSFVWPRYLTSFKKLCTSKEIVTIKQLHPSHQYFIPRYGDWLEFSSHV